MSTVTLTCHNVECPNADQPIVVEYDAVSQPTTAQCGPCGAMIDDIEQQP